ncbi:MAG TPA: hypothetical protein VGC91_18395 [Pyrinomonadaceae bacterium]|jgi:hypothetical protein
MIKADSETEKDMRRRRITLKDGRYLIFYTFGDKGAESDSHNEAAKHESVKAGLEIPGSKRDGDV